MVRHRPEARSAGTADTNRERLPAPRESCATRSAREDARRWIVRSISSARAASRSGGNRISSPTNRSTMSTRDIEPTGVPWRARHAEYSANFAGSLATTSTSDSAHVAKPRKSRPHATTPGSPSCPSCSHTRSVNANSLLSPYVSRLGSPTGVSPHASNNQRFVFDVYDLRC